jgi:hypothetical protein
LLLAIQHRTLKIDYCIDDVVIVAIDFITGACAFSIIACSLAMQHEKFGWLLLGAILHSFVAINNCHCSLRLTEKNDRYCCFMQYNIKI